MSNEALDKTLFDLKQTIVQTMGTPVHKAGWPFIIGFALVSVLLAMMSSVLGTIGLVLTLWCLYFFRDPIRAVPQKDGLVLSPADGRVTAVTENVALPIELLDIPTATEQDNEDKDENDDADKNEGEQEDATGEYTRISIFLSVFDVHVNRVPASGIIKKVVYSPGKFLNAGNERASMENERSAALIELDNGQTLGVVQIAGLVARRIISELKEGDNVTKGHRYGLIRFGSRLDVYLPTGTAPRVAIGQRMIGGETVLAEIGKADTDAEAQSI